jgi:hypothetical protein
MDGRVGDTIGVLVTGVGGAGYAVIERNHHAAFTAIAIHAAFQTVAVFSVVTDDNVAANASHVNT